MGTHLFLFSTGFLSIRISDNSVSLMAWYKHKQHLLSSKVHFVVNLIGCRRKGYRLGHEINPSCTYSWLFGIIQSFEVKWMSWGIDFLRSNFKSSRPCTFQPGSQPTDNRPITLEARSPATQLHISKQAYKDQLRQCATERGLFTTDAAMRLPRSLMDAVCRSIPLCALG